LHMPSPLLCTDNGAMIASAGVFRFRRGERTPLEAEVDSSLRLGV
jgi:tRNA A37 threonylcarbamoyltransferase TsaD